MKSLYELIGLDTDMANVSNNNDEYMAEISYRLSPDGTIDVSITWAEEVGEAASIIGAMLTHINNGMFTTQTAHTLHELGKNMKYKTFAAKTLECWITMNNLHNDIPVVGPSEVGKVPAPPWSPHIEEGDG